MSHAQSQQSHRSVPLGNAESNSTASDADSVEMSVDSTCSSLHCPKAIDATLPRESANRINVAERVKPTDGVTKVQSSNLEAQDRSRDSVPDSLESISAFQELMTKTKYTTQEIELCLARTQKLFQQFQGLKKKHNDFGFEIWTQLKSQLQDLETRFFNPRGDVKQKYLHDVGRFKSRVSTCLRSHERDFRNLLSGQSKNMDGQGAPVVWSSQRLATGALLRTFDEPPRKRKCLSDWSGSTSSRSPPDLDIDLSSASPAASSHTCSEEVESFLDQLADEIYISILSGLCPDNMRGSFCKAPSACIDRGRFFACPEYAIHQRCVYERKQLLSHAGFKHTVKGCHVHYRNECKLMHPDGRKCRIKVVFFHIRASCMSIHGSSFVCRTSPCRFGHDNPAIRKMVMAQDQ